MGIVHISEEEAVKDFSVVCHALMKVPTGSSIELLVISR